MVSLPRIVLVLSLAYAAVAPAWANTDASPATKPWLDDPAAYFSAHADRQWVIGHSSVACLSAAEALDSACRDGARQLALLREGKAHAAPHATRSPDRLTARMLAELNAGRLIRDRYFARVKKPYGEIWTAAVLVDASDDALRRIAADDAAAERARGIAGVCRAGMLAGLCTAILLAYAGLNAVTRGYFRGRLRIGAALCMLGIILMLHVGWTG